MPRPTIAAIRRALDDLGVPQVDPSSWFDGTMPEILRAAIDMGPIAPLATISFIQNLTFASAPVTIETFDITGAEDGTIRVVKSMTIRIVTENIEDIRLQKFDGLITNILWRDEQLPHQQGQYIGTDNNQSQAWGALGLNNVVLYPRELTDSPGITGQLQIRLESAAAVVKTVTVSMTLIDFNSRLFTGGSW